MLTEWLKLKKEEALVVGHFVASLWLKIKMQLELLSSNVVSYIVSGHMFYGGDFICGRYIDILFHIGISTSWTMWYICGI